MSNSNGGISCTLGCWGLAVVVAGISWLMLMFVGDWTFLQASFAAIVIAIILGALLSWILCRPLQTTATASAPAPTKASTAPAETSQPEPEPEAGPASTPAPAAATTSAAAVTPSADLPGQTELAERKGEWKYEGEEKPKPKAKAKAKPKKAKKEKPAPAADMSEDYDKDGVLEGADEGKRPEALDGPRGGKADNLKEIKGIGPKMEKMCNALGFYHFDQIANWSADEVAWVNANLEGFKGRVTRDEWVAQAKILATGGETEFSKRVEDGDVY
ncbi:MAG: endonuclease [Pseudomonadota bacterium]